MISLCCRAAIAAKYNAFLSRILPSFDRFVCFKLVPDCLLRGVTPAFAERVTKEAKKAAAQAKKRVKSFFPEWNVRPDMMIGTPAWVLIDMVDNYTLKIKNIEILIFVQS